MATRKGPKVEPHTNPRLENFKVEIEDLREKPKAQVFEEVHEKLMTPEEIIAQEEFINESDEIEEIKENLNKYHNLDAEVEMMKLIQEAGEPTEPPKEFNFKFQNEYHFGPGNGDAVIDMLPQPTKRKKRMDELNQTELRMFHKTGFMPEI